MLYIKLFVFPNLIYLSWGKQITWNKVYDSKNKNIGSLTGKIPFGDQGSNPCLY